MATKKSDELRRLETVSRHLLPSIGGIPSSAIVQAAISSQPGQYLLPGPVVIGGMVLDIHAKPQADPKPGTTTPGQVCYLSGGVARNIAECLSKLGVEPFMISILGYDAAGESLLTYWKTANLSTEGILQLKGVATPIVSNIFDCLGELFAAVASIDAVEVHLSPSWIWRFSHNISRSPLLIVDANLHPVSLQTACERHGIPVWFEPVSVTKSTRIALIINHITFASPNENELIAMANALSTERKYEIIPSDASDAEHLFQMLKPAMLLLLREGVKFLLVTVGSSGVFLCCNESQLNDKLLDISTRLCIRSGNAHSSKQIGDSSSRDGTLVPSAFHLPALPTSVVSLTGAGDCFVGGVTSALCAGCDLLQSVAVGIATAKMAIRSNANVPDDFPSRNISDDANVILSASRRLL